MAARARAAIAALVLWLAAAGAVFAQVADKPTWAALTPAERQVLAPLANEWPRLSRDQRRHLIRAADHYYKMKPAAQARFQKRLHAWATMTPEQRRVARENYLKFKALPPKVQQSLRRKWVQRQRGSQASRAAPGQAGRQVGPRP